MNQESTLHSAERTAEFWLVPVVFSLRVLNSWAKNCIGYLGMCHLLGCCDMLHSDLARQEWDNAERLAWDIIHPSPTDFLDKL